MAKHNNRINLQTVPEQIAPVEEEVVNTHSHALYRDDDDDTNQSIDATPMVQIVLEMALVAEGKSINDLRVLVRKLYPKTPQEAAEFKRVIDHLKLVAEAVAMYSADQYTGLTVPK